MTSLNLNAQAIADILACDEDTANFFREELAGLPKPRDSDLVSLSTLATYNSPRVARSSFYSLRRSLSRVSIADSVDLFGGRHFTLRELCDFIANHESLQTAVIVSCSCYAVPSSFFLVPHRFLVFQLQRNGRKDVWMRLDRRPSSNVGPSGLSLTSGVTPSNDTAQLASSLDYLLPPKASQENQIAFIEPCLLATLRLTLLDVIVVMDEYKLTSENCWAFCSLLQNDLFKKGKARLEQGDIHHASLARKASQRLSHRRLAPILSPLDPSLYVPLSTLFEVFRENPNDEYWRKRVGLAIELTRRWEDSDGFSSLEGQQLAREVLHSMNRIPIMRIYQNSNTQLALQLMALCHHIGLTTREPRTQTDRSLICRCVELLCHRGKWCLERTPRNLQAALKLFEDATSILVPGVILNSQAAKLHYNHAVTLHTLGRVDEAKRVVVDFIECIRHEESMDWGAMGDLKRRALWPSEFNYLFSRKHIGGDLHKTLRWREVWVESQAYPPSSLSYPLVSPLHRVFAAANMTLIEKKAGPNIEAHQTK